MKSIERKYQILKGFLKQYKSRKIKDDEVVSIIEEMVADYESAIITLDIHKRKKKGGVRK
jgi:uncharacterized protein YeeX (DUF496 family)